MRNGKERFTVISMLAACILLGGAIPTFGQSTPTPEESSAPEAEVREPPTSFAETWELVQETLQDMWIGFVRHLPLLAVALVILVLTWIVVRIARAIANRVMSRSRFRRSLKDLVQQVLGITIWLIGLLTASVVVFPGMTPGKLITVFGLSSIAIGFAFKDIFENFFAGILILWRFPFEPGDFIKCDDIVGKVENVSIRMTELRLTTGELVILPNATLFKNSVTVLTDREIRRVTVMCGVGYGEDVDESRDVIRKAVQECSSVSSEKDVEIFAQEFGSSSINFEVTWWTKPTPLDVRSSRDEVVARVKSALDDAGIEIPFPYRTLTFSEPLQTKSAEDRSE